MAIFDNIFQTNRSEPGNRTDFYVQDLEKVKFTIDGVEREFVGGSYDGVPFFVASHDLNFGRRLVVNNMPNADTNVIQDLGRKTRGVSISAYLLGSDVFSQKQKLIDAMERGGKRPLIHPYLGPFTARGGEGTLKERELVKQFAQVDLTFVIENDSVTNKEAASRDAVLAAAVQASDDSVLADFVRLFNAVQDTTNGVVDAAADGVNSAVDGVFEARQSLRNVSLFVEKIKAIKTNLSILLGSPDLLGQALLDLVGFENEDDPDRNYKNEQNESVAGSLWSNDTPNLVTGAQSENQIRDNDNALNSLMKQGNAGQAAAVTPLVVYDSVQDAGDSIAALGTAFDGAQLAATSDGAYYSALSLQTQTQQYIAEISQDLASIETIELDYSTTAITLTYELYGSLDNLPDYLKRNRIKDPFFLPPYTPFEVLSGGDE